MFTIFFSAPGTSDAARNNVALITTRLLATPNLRALLLESAEVLKQLVMRLLVSSYFYLHAPILRLNSETNSNRRYKPDRRFAEQKSSY